MNIGLLSKRTTTLAGRIKQFYEELGHNVTIFTADNLSINESLLEYDFFILKSKRLIYLYAGFFIKAHGVPIFPDPDLTYKHKYRIDAHYLIQQAGLRSPNFYLGSKDVINNFLSKKAPLVSKSLMDSGSKDVKFINSNKDLSTLDENVVYFEEKIKGTHYLMYFIDDEISVSEKPPLSNEHAPMTEITPSQDMIAILRKWREYHDIPFGHLDVIKEESTNNIYVVDPGCFPEFSNWKRGDDPCPKICNIILKRISNIKKLR